MDSLYGKNTIKNLFGNEKLVDLILDNHTVKIKSEVIKVASKKTLIEENTIHDSFYFIKEGIFVLKKGNQIVDLIGESSVIGLYDLFIGEKSSLGVMSLTSAVLVKIKKEELLAILFSIQEGAIFHINYMHSTLNSLISHRNLLGLPLKKKNFKSNGKNSD
ncbi:cyclic nucleotide-binding domain-containing protein [Carnobacterium divergens]|uniref:cyclic nucleotide-binding domain-containing protein n=1 Tax=Carnobacterium divergens TaxID=2748 RepID=UPI00143146F5|nr:cyclic nucleotide-binding domain-containing protein [Carnobacterium divergens]